MTVDTANDNGIDPDAAVRVLHRMRRNCDNLRKAVRWTKRGSPKRWSESELCAEEHRLQTEMDALDLAIATLSLLTTNMGD